MPIIFQDPDFSCPPVAIPFQEPVTNCKICDAPSHLHGVVDFNKSCREADGVRVYHLFGAPVYYYRCLGCGFLFSRAFDHWTIDQFNDWIYDDGYVRVDPDYIEKRPSNYGSFLVNTLSEMKESIVGLDYGGGNGLLSNILKSSGFDYQSWDPMIEMDTPLESKNFNLITAIEVLEHTPDPMEMFRLIAERLDEAGVFLFSTMPSDDIPVGAVMNWWYVAPANGHISIMALASIRELCARNGMSVIHKKHIHLAYKNDSALLRKIESLL